MLCKLEWEVGDWGCHGSQSLTRSEGLLLSVDLGGLQLDEMRSLLWESSKKAVSSCGMVWCPNTSYAKRV